MEEADEPLAPSVVRGLVDANWWSTTNHDFRIHQQWMDISFLAIKAHRRSINRWHFQHVGPPKPHSTVFMIFMGIHHPPRIRVDSGLRNHEPWAGRAAEGETQLRSAPSSTRWGGRAEGGLGNQCGKGGLAGLAKTCCVFGGFETSCSTRVWDEWYVSWGLKPPTIWKLILRSSVSGWGCRKSAPAAPRHFFVPILIPLELSIKWGGYGSNSGTPWRGWLQTN